MTVFSSIAPTGYPARYTGTCEGSVHDFPGHTHNQTFCEAFDLNGARLVYTLGTDKRTPFGKKLGSSILCASYLSSGPVYTMTRSDDNGLTWASQINLVNGGTYDSSLLDGLMSTGDTTRIHELVITKTAGGYSYVVANSGTYAIKECDSIPFGSDLIAVVTTGSSYYTGLSTDKGVSWTLRSAALSSSPRYIVNVTGSTWIVYSFSGQYQTSTDNAVTFGSSTSLPAITGLGTYTFAGSTKPRMLVRSVVKTSDGSVFMALARNGYDGSIANGYDINGLLNKKINVFGVYVLKSTDGINFRLVFTIPVFAIPSKTHHTVFLTETASGRLGVFYEDSNGSNTHIKCVTLNTAGL